MADMQKTARKVAKLAGEEAREIGDRAQAVAKRVSDRVTGKARRRRKIKVAATVAGIAAAVVAGVAVKKARGNRKRGR